ncbi:hypothetical protein ONR57_19385 [Hoyosella sp. YIM 151337]|uniref:hypothetical protein n=1 Tax=Hoyosella sp. YIM 151337 TaxID=2992742 RepID=UPI00223625B7|nr:hypothetical protein [Hoyosella sp. YIM 151337]MCW4355470.1 hypothetical protein [Hoyosella sp. YIM 151337]
MIFPVFLPRSNRARHRGTAGARGTAAGLLVFTLATGCTIGSEPADEPGAAEETAQEFAIPVPPVTVTVEEPGAEPRQILAPDLSEGARHSTVLTVTSEVFQQLGDEPEADLSRPAVTVPLDSEVVAAEGGEWTVTFTIGRAESRDAIVNYSLGAAEGSVAGLSIMSDGSVPELRITPNAEADDVARSTIEQALFQAVYGMVVFPQEPVGAGARWTIEQPVAQSGMEIVQRTTVTLREVSGTAALLDLEIEQQPRLPYLEVPDEGRISVDEFDVSGGGALTVDLERPLPAEGSTSVRGTQLYSDPDTGYTARQRVSMTTGWSAP